MIHENCRAFFIMRITVENIERAKRILRKMPTSELQMFRYLSALNLLNAAVKQTEHSGIIQYKNFKCKIEDLLRYFLRNKDVKLCESFEYNPMEKIVYITCFNVQFSFHYELRPNNEYLIIFNNNSKWCGIRLQPIAEQLFLKALNIK